MEQQAIQDLRGIIDDLEVLRKALHEVVDESKSLELYCIWDRLLHLRCDNDKTCCPDRWGYDEVD